MSTLTKEQLINLVREIQTANVESEQEHDDLLALLKANVLDPHVSDLIYYHQPELTPEEIIEKALAYKPIQL